MSFKLNEKTSLLYNQGPEKIFSKKIENPKKNAKYIYPRIYRNKTMADELINIPNDDKHNYIFCRLQLVIETFASLNLMNQPIKI